MTDLDSREVEAVRGGHPRADVRARLGHAVRRHRLVVGLLILVSVPFAIGEARLAAAGSYYTYGDRALIDAAVHRSLDVMQYTGVYSRYGWNHPGPLYFYFLAPGKLVDPSAMGLSIGALFSNWLFVVLGVVLAVRTARPRTAVVFAAVLLLWVLIIGPVLLRDPWNPVIGVVPLMVAVVAAALRPSLGSACLMAVGCSLALQAHVGTISLVVTVALGAVGLHVLSAFGPAWLGRPRLLPRLRPTVLVMVLTLGCWALPLIDQLRHGRRGNLARIIDFNLHSGGPHLSLDAAARAVVGASWLPDALAVVPPRVVPGPVWLWIVGWLALAAIGAQHAWRRQLREPLALFVLSVVGLAMVVLAVSHVAGALEVYLLWWAPLPVMTLVAGWAVLVLGAEGLARRPNRWAGALLGAVALALSTASGASATLAVGESSSVDVGQASQLILDHLHRSGPVVLDLPDLSMIGQAAGVAAALLDHGRAVVVPMAPDHFETRGSNRPPAAVVRLAAAGSAADTGGVLLGVVSGGPAISVRLLS